MAWDSGNILFSSNFEMRVGKPLDAKQVVTNNLDLNDITFPYDGLIVHVTSTDETYVCVAKDDVPTGVSGGGAIDAAVWKNVGGGAADVVVLPDQGAAPSGIADKSQLVSLDDATAESRPDFLYLFDEGVDVATATDDGRLQSDGTKYNSGGSGYNVTGSAPWGNRARFNHLAVSKISVGTAGAAAPFYFTSDTGDRGDFEIQFRFVLDADDVVYCLMSTDATDATTEGFYAVLVDSDTGVNDSSITFRSMHSIDSVVTQFEAEWTIPGDVNWLTAHHLAISFMEDDRSIAGNTNGGGKLRCYFDGIALEDDKTAGAYSITAPEFNNIGRKPSTSTIWPVNLGQYLDGSGGSSVYYLDGDMDEFAVYNHRCLHNTSDKFTPPAAPTRAAALSVPNVVDSEGTASPIITASNAGMLLPKAVEGLADGSLWNDKGVVKVAPLTGDLDDAIEAALDPVVDDVLSLAEGAAPAATTGVAKIYAKIVVSNPTVLFHFDDNFDDSSTGGTFDATAVGPPSFQLSDVGGAGWGKKIDFGNTAAGAASEYLTFPDPVIGTGAFTFECFFSTDAASSGQALFSEGGNTGNGTAYGDVMLELSFGAGTDGKHGFQMFQADVSGNWKYVRWGSTATGHLWDTGAMKHVALVRGPSVSGTSQWSLYLDGDYIPPNTSSDGSPTDGNVVTVDMGGQAYSLGTPPMLTQYAFNGQMDEVQITLSDQLYTGTTGNNDYVVPTAPFAGSTITKLFAMDSDGNETQLT